MTLLSACRSACKDIALEQLMYSTGYFEICRPWDTLVLHAGCLKPFIPLFVVGEHGCFVQSWSKIYLFFFITGGFDVGFLVCLFILLWFTTAVVFNGSTSIILRP